MECSHCEYHLWHGCPSRPTWCRSFWSNSGRNYRFFWVHHEHTCRLSTMGVYPIAVLLLLFPSKMVPVPNCSPRELLPSQSVPLTNCSSHELLPSWIVPLTNCSHHEWFPSWIVPLTNNSPQELFPTLIVPVTDCSHHWLFSSRIVPLIPVCTWKSSAYFAWNIYSFLPALSWQLLYSFLIG